MRRQVEQSKTCECLLGGVVRGILPDYLGWFGTGRYWLCCLSRGLAPKYATEVAVLAKGDGIHEASAGAVESKAWLEKWLDQKCYRCVTFVDNGQQGKMKACNAVSMFCRSPNPSDALSCALPFLVCLTLAIRSTKPTWPNRYRAMQCALRRLLSCCLTRLPWCPGSCCSVLPGNHMQTTTLCCGSSSGTSSVVRRVSIAWMSADSDDSACWAGKMDA